MRKIVLIATISLLALIASAGLIAFVQAHRTPLGRPEYVALGSSFAAGAGLGPLQPDSPTLCARSMNGYPQHLARLRQLTIVDMSCGGAVTRNLLRGGQFLQGPQRRTITRETRLVTITIGGNDVGYVGDLSMLAARHSNTVFGRLVRLFWNGPRTPAERHYDVLGREILATLRAVHAAAPAARIIVATYPAILPRTGTCARLGLTIAEADAMRRVGNTLAAVTRAAAHRGGALVVDMHVLGADHDACSRTPWTYGWTNASLAPFHPTALGAVATAKAISMAIDDASRMKAADIGPDPS